MVNNKNNGCSYQIITSQPLSNNMRKLLLDSKTVKFLARWH